MVTCILCLMNVHVYLNLTSYELPSRGAHTTDAKGIIVFWAKLTISWWLSLFPQTASQPTKRKLPDWAERPNATVTAATEKKTKKKKGLFGWHSWVLLSCLMYILIFCTRFLFIFFFINASEYWYNLVLRECFLIICLHLLSRLLLLVKGINSLNSSRCFSEFSQVHTIVRDSFLICAYHVSDSMSGLELNATGFHLSLWKHSSQNSRQLPDLKKQGVLPTVVGTLFH